MVPEILEFEVLTLDCVGGSVRGRRGSEGLQIDEAACGLYFHSWMLAVRCVVAEIAQSKDVTGIVPLLNADCHFWSTKRLMCGKRSPTIWESLESIGPVVPEIQRVFGNYPHFPILGNFILNDFTRFKK